MVAAGGACRPVVAPSPVSPSPSSSAVDVLAYVIGDTASWPRVGNHSQNQVVDEARREVCWVKYANPRTFECWRWDDSFIYHVVDHGIDGNTGESYSFADGRWMPRYLTGEWRLDVSTAIVWFDPACGVESTRSATTSAYGESRPSMPAATSACVTLSCSSTRPRIRRAGRPSPSTSTSRITPAGTSGGAGTCGASSTGSADRLGRSRATSCAIRPRRRRSSSTAANGRAFEESASGR